MTYTDEELNEFPVDSYAGQERDLADMLNEDTLDWLETCLEYDPTEDDLSLFYAFNLLMMHPAAAQKLVNIDEAEQDLQELITNIKDNANDISGDVFQQRVAQRVRMRKMLRRLGDIARANGMED